MPAKDTSTTNNNINHGSSINGTGGGTESSKFVVGAGVGSDPETRIIRRDMDHLVQNIKDNLKLGYDPHHPQAVNFSGAVASAVEWRKAQLANHPPPPTLDWQPATTGGVVRKARSYMASRVGSSRASPYSVPGKVISTSDGLTTTDSDGSGGHRHHNGGSWAARKRYPSMSASGGSKHHTQQKSAASTSSSQQKSVSSDTGDMDDPLEMLHELISEGNLLKEAVRRLQMGLSPKIQNRNFYDSDEEGGCRSPTTGITQHHYPTGNTNTNTTEICSELGIN